MGALKSLEDLLQWEISNLYYSIHKQLDILPVLRDCARSPQLKYILSNQVPGQAENLNQIDKVLEALNKKPLNDSYSSAVKSIISEGLDTIEMTTISILRDASIISTIQSLHHHDIARLIMANAYAHKLGKPEISAILTSSLERTNVYDEELSFFAGGKDYAEDATVTPLSTGGIDIIATLRLSLQSSWPQ